MAREYIIGRLERVRELRGVTYINDSIGSSPSRTIAGLRALKRKPIVIVGGYDKHIPFDALGFASIWGWTTGMNSINRCSRRRTVPC